MAKLSQTPAHSLHPNLRASGQPRAFGAGYIFGIPVGDLGWFASVLMGFAVGFAAFFAATFFAIMTILVYNTAGHHTLDYAISYRRIGLPIGIAVATLALAYLGSLWIRRQIRRS